MLLVAFAMCDIDMYTIWKDVIGMEYVGGIPKSMITAMNVWLLTLFLCISSILFHCDAEKAYGKSCFLLNYIYFYLFATLDVF